MARIVNMFVAMLALTVAAPAYSSGLDYVGECVPFARATSGIQIYGDAWTWWNQAAGKYDRGDRPSVGSVIVFARSSHLRLGHVAVVSRVVTSRVLMITHANWSRVDGARGHAEQDVTITDLSPDNDWSEVKVWYRDSDGLGSTVYPVYGFIYGTPDAHASASIARARPATYLTSSKPDYVGALIDVYVPTVRRP